jgi:hypothetical protein
MKKMKTVYKMVALTGLALFFVGCSEQLPIMTTAQQQTYNTCMSDRWSGAADTFWWGPFGWAYHSSVVKDCLAKSGSLGETTTAEATAPATTAQATQPAPTGVAGTAPNAQSAPGPTAH